MCPVKIESTKTSLPDNYDIREQLEQFVIANDVDVSDDDVDEAEDQAPQFLGFVVDDPENQSSLLLELFPNVAGGTPTWLEPVHLPSGKASVCGFCEEPLQFVLQINAPLDDKESAYHRTIFVFMCPSMACLRMDQHAQQKSSNEGKNRSVKVFRCQMLAVNSFYTIDSESSHFSAIDQPGSRAALCSWCNTWKGDQLCTGCRRVRYCSRKHQIKHWRSGHKDHCKQIVNSDAAINTSWPQYEIIFRKSDPELPVVNDSLSLIPGTDETIMSMLDCFEGDEDKQCWASFQAHIAKDSAQVLRCWKEEGKPLWPELHGRPCAEDIPNCNDCGGPMRFEFQIMPQLLAFFNVQNESESLDWATIAIYTCEASCDSPLVYKEEFPWVQLYSN